MKTTVLFLFTILLSLPMFSQNENFDWGNLARYAAANKNLSTPNSGEQRVVFMGNSITEGWKNADSAFFANPLYIDRGISGQTTPQMLLRFRQDVVELKPAAVVILAGINDIAENTGPISLEGILANIQSMAELAEANNIKVLLCSVLPANVIPWKRSIVPAEKVITLNAMIEAYCKEKNIPYVDYYSPLVDENKGLDKKYSDDGVHPNLAGYHVMEPLVEQAIRAALQK